MPNSKSRLKYCHAQKQPTTSVFDATVNMPLQEPGPQHPYPDYADSFDQEKHKWLAEYLRLGVSSKEVQDYDPDSGIDVFDVIDRATFIRTPIRYPKDTPNGATDPQLFTALDNVPDVCSTRIWALQKRGSYSHIHRATYNAIGYKYGIDRDFSRHISHCSSWNLILKKMTKSRMKKEEWK